MRLLALYLITGIAISEIVIPFSVPSRQETKQMPTTIPKLADTLGVPDKTIRRIVDRDDIAVEKLNATTWLVPERSAKRIAKAIRDELKEAAVAYDNCVDFIGGR